MMRSRTLYRDSLVSLVRYDHPPDHEHRDPEVEIAASHAVSFIESGWFDFHHAKRRWRMDPASLFVTHPGLVYRCSHPREVPDDVCLAVYYSPELVEDLHSSSGRKWSRRLPAAALTNRLAYLRLRLVEAAEEGDGPMAATMLAGELLAALDSGGSEAGRLFRDRQLSWYARRVETAREMLSEQFAEPHTIRSTAREAGMSPFHFSRVFRELVGVPPHRYLLGVRLARAAERLRQGAGVTETCLATGFNNLGHFTRTFRRAFGVSPSRYRG